MKVYDQDLPEEVVTDLQKCTMVGVDTETTGLNPHRDRVCLVQIFDPDTKLVHAVKLTQNTKDHAAELSPNLRRFLVEGAKPPVHALTILPLKIFHFAPFDVKALKGTLGVDTTGFTCTRMLSKIARTYSPKHSLKDVLKEMLGVPMDKTQQTSYWGAEDLTQAQLEYAAKDVIYLPELYLALCAQIFSEGRRAIQIAAETVLPSMIYLEQQGWDSSLFGYSSS